MGIPAYVRVAVVAQASSMSVEDARKLLGSSGALVRHSGQRFWVSTARLRDALPDAYAKLYERFVIGAEEARNVER